MSANYPDDIPDEELTFESKHQNTEPSKEFFSGDIVKFSCGLSIVSHLQKMTSTLVIYDLKKKFKTTTNVTFSNQKYKHTNDATFKINTRGITPFYCSWTFGASDDDYSFKRTLEKNLSITVYSK